MSITKQQVEKIAGLARLGLTGKEKMKFAKELSSILEFVNKLEQVKIDKVEPTAQVTGLENVMREDEAQKKTQAIADKLIELAPQTESGHVKVKTIL